MEIEGAEKRKCTVCFYEALGTGLFVYGAMLTNNPVSISFSLFCSIILLANVSGGHINPAVTLGVYISQAKFKENLGWLFSISISQLLGALGAALLAQATLYADGFENVPDEFVPRLCPQDPSNKEWPAVKRCDNELGTGYTCDLQVIVHEMILTFVFVSVILMVKGKYTAPTADTIIAVLTIALTLQGCVGTGQFLGGAVNPAVSFGVTLFGAFHLQEADGPSFISHYTYAYMVGELLGGLLAGLFHLKHAQLFAPKNSLDK